MEETDHLELDYYSDVLCVWAWVSERRNQELLDLHPGRVSLRCHFLDLFADTVTRLEVGWQDRGGYSGFAEHIRSAAKPYDAPVHADVWERVRPTTSANAHLVIKAVESMTDRDAGRHLASELRRKFFIEAVDIGRLPVVYEISDALGHDVDALRRVVEDGRAIAALLADSKQAQENRVSGSPTWVMNSGRQILYGNVGYRVLQANVEELLKRPQHEASWC